MLHILYLFAEGASRPREIGKRLNLYTQKPLLTVWTHAGYSPHRDFLLPHRAGRSGCVMHINDGDELESGGDSWSGAECRRRS